MLTSETVTGENFAACGPRWFLGNEFPEFHQLNEQQLALKFTPSVEIVVHPSIFDDEEQGEEEISIRSPSGSYWGYDFEREWFETF